MKVIEERVNNRTGEKVEVSWGNAITSDFSIIQSVVSIVEMKRDQQAGRDEPDHNPILDRFTTTGIRIVLED